MPVYNTKWLQSQGRKAETSSEPPSIADRLVTNTSNDRTLVICNKTLANNPLHDKGSLIST